MQVAGFICWIAAMLIFVLSRGQLFRTAGVLLISGLSLFTLHDHMYVHPIF